MNFAAMIVPLLLQYGPDAALKIIALMKNPNPVSLDEWEEVIKTLDKSYASYIADARGKLS